MERKYSTQLGVFTLLLIVHRARVSDHDSLKSVTLKTEEDCAKQSALSKDGPGPTRAFLLQNKDPTLSMNVKARISESMFWGLFFCFLFSPLSALNACCLLGDGSQARAMIH